MIVSNYYLSLSDNTTQNPVTMSLLGAVKDFRYMSDALVDTLVFSGELTEMTEENLNTVENYRENGYRLSVKGSAPDTLTKFPFLSHIFHKSILYGVSLSPVELNTMYMLGFVREPQEGDNI